MLESHHNLLTDVLSSLERICGERASPSQAQRQFSELRARHSTASIDLVWDEQAFDLSRHYDALVRPPGFAGIVALSVCPDDTLPWPLRGLQPWRDSDLLRVNGTVMPVENAIQQLDLLWQKTPLMQRLIDSCLIEAELQRRQIEVTPDEVQSAIDEMRRRRGLLSAADTNAWLVSSGMSMHGLSDLAVKLARAAKLREAVVGHEVNRHLEQHQTNFDIVHVRVLQSPDAATIRQVAEAVRNGSCEFLDAAEEAVFRDITGRTELFSRREPRHRLLARLADEEHVLTQVVSIEPADRNPNLRSAVVAHLFEEWLRERRESAHIEWFWGPSRAAGDATK
jgi:putative peptide maturation system protein